MKTSQERIDRKAYALAKKYLLQLDVNGLTPQLLEKYLRPPVPELRPKTLAGIYKRILQSAQSANMKAGVIGGAIGGIDRLAIVLCEFQPDKVLRKYRSGWEQVLNETERRLRPNGKIRRMPNSIWPRYCQTVLSAASFITQFATAGEFYRWVDCFDRDERARAALPILLSFEIDGLGFALACDFLKELGYVNFAKPDVHLKDIFEGLELCAARPGNYELFKAVIRVASNAGVTPYNVDKLFWLVGSGYFYDDDHIGRRGRIKSIKKDFIVYARQRLGER